MHQVVGELTHELTVLEVSPTAEEVSLRIAEVSEGEEVETSPSFGH